MEITTETERKYDVPENFELPDLIGAAGIAGVDGAETHDLDATYFDTDDLRLMRNRRTLRHRTGGHDAGWHLKTPGDGTGRKEHRLAGQAAEVVPDELVGLVRGIVRRRPLLPVARLQTHRVETPLRDRSGRVLALVAQDQVRATDENGVQTAWQEIEVELVDGDTAVLDAVQRKLAKKGARPASGPSKVSRALAGRLAAATTTATVKGKVNPVFRYAREQRDAILEHDPAARHGEETAVHKMRVATRRLRSTLKTYRKWFPASPVRDELRWLARLLGAVRDPQVLEARLLAGVEESGPEFVPVAQRIRESLDGKAAAGRAELAAALDSDRYLDLLDAIDALVDRPSTPGPDPAKRARKVLDKADGELNAARESGVDEQLHESRKTFKQARYAIELIAPEHGKRAERLVDALTGLQDGLGAHQDSVIARETLREIGSDSFHFGVLYGRQEQVGKETLAEVPALVRAARRKRVRRWLKKT
ncbi:CYTH and CHAD domain-containing protein [Actinoplanes sp. NBRC 101535]|uniref:CYTH and CHAD domain-containing protein n=1 Tax=Actinoplanes sp. NBRC 101535 TaxID=3032196 RepID=UPI0024A0BCB2|nr:CYTH and CHAD domain-containing protein [Actinoplanes sp. NBRC 101535]GLY01108.1 CHAD domain-containing protein [Actinoplanes sp. NBRC 101535]